jgi:four helix bundle protein
MIKYTVSKSGSGSGKAVKSTLVEGYGRRRYKQDFIIFLIYSLSSNDETIDHPETIYETKSLQNEDYYNTLHDKIESLGKKINNFLKTVELKHNTFDSSSVL